MPSSSQRDYKQKSISTRSNRRRNSLTPKRNSLIAALSSWYFSLPNFAKILLPVGGLLLVTGLLWPTSNSDTDNEFEKQPFVENLDSNNSDKITLSLDLPNRANNSSIPNKELLSLSTDENALEFSISNGDTLGELFQKNNLSYQDMLTILKDKTAKQHLTRIKVGDKLHITKADSEGSIQEIRYPLGLEEQLVVTRNGDSFKSTVENTPLERREAYAHGVIEDSLFLAGQEAGLTDTSIMNLAGIFRWDVDFVLDIRKNDSFTVIYEELWKNGEYLGNGNIIAAEFINDGDVYHAIRFEDDTGDSNYYAPNGKSMKKAFLRAPIAFSPRVTSSFNPRRMHPVHKRVRPHRGVDYGGPMNTPILAAGDGKVIFRGRKGGYGNTVILQHGGNITTLYAHLNKFNSKAKRGKRVKQGQTIGYLGKTGTVTAKHLHYEYRLNGVHRNPRTVKLPNAKPLPKKYKAEFEKAKAPLLKQLDVIKRANTLNADTKPTGSSSASAGSSASGSTQ